MDVLKLVADYIIWPLLGYLAYSHQQTSGLQTRLAVIEAKVEDDRKISAKQTEQIFSRLDKFEERILSKIDTLEDHLRGQQNG